MSVIVWLRQNEENTRKYRELEKQHKLGGWKIWTEPESNNLVLKLSEDLSDPIAQIPTIDARDLSKVTVQAIYDDVRAIDGPTGLLDGTYAWSGANLYARSNFNYGPDRTTIQRRITLNAPGVPEARTALEFFFSCDPRLSQIKNFMADPQAKAPEPATE